ncbi:hypothetical protein ACH4UM_34415 [Streptomyces sp. NPDC020801]|uniref:hypothetical protein n=1 Tax=unclassified Streptomyces TaxID=2593676 RepID=UPI0037ABA188
MSDLAPLLQGFFTDKLMLQLQASPHTIAAYRDTFTLLLGFAEQRTGHRPTCLSIADLDAPTIGASSSTWKPTAATPPQPATPAWPLSVRSSATRPCGPPSTRQ